MGKLVTVVGNSGVGKTTFCRRLRQVGRFSLGLEEHQSRPFQQAFFEDHERFGLLNQADYLLFRAGQELSIRKGEHLGIQDGGLEMDFFVFTRLFYLRGYLGEAGYQFCEQLVASIRSALPPPDLILRLVAPLEVVASRYAQRNRGLEIVRSEDLKQIEILLDDWIGNSVGIQVLTVDVAPEDASFARQIAVILPQLDTHLSNPLS